MWVRRGIRRLCGAFARAVPSNITRSSNYMTDYALT